MPSCYAYGCSNSNVKPECKGVRFFRIPSVSREPERRKLWLQAIRRQGEPYTAARICSDHFVSGTPSCSSDKENPDYVPSIFCFPSSHRAAGNPSQRLERFKRLKTRNPSPNSESRGQQVNLHSNLISIIFDSEDVTEEGDVVELQEQHEESGGISTQTETAHVQDAATNTDGTDPENLRTIIGMLMEKNEKLESENSALKEEVRRLKHPDQGYHEIQNDDTKHAFYTGLPTVSSFLFLVRVLCLAGFKPFRKMSIENTLFVLLLKLRLGLKNKDIAYRLGVPHTHVSTVLSTRLPILAGVCRCFIRWPTREAIVRNMPNCFRSASSVIRRTRVIIDCFEIFTERPKSLTPRAQLWSNYKSHSTVKFLIGISPMGSVSYMSDAWGGRASDKMITLDSDMLELLEPTDVVLADRGFLIKDEFELYGVKVVTPHFTKGKKQMSQKDVQESRSLSRVRIHVERVIGRLRRQFHVLNMTLPLSLVPQVDNIVVACAGLINLHRAVV